MELSWEITTVTPPGSPTNWNARFMHNGIPITSITVPPAESETIGVEVSVTTAGVVHETATVRITGQDGYLPITGPLNTTRTSQNNIIGQEIILTTRVGRNYDPHVEIAPGTPDSLRVNALTSTVFEVKVSNFGLQMDSIRLLANVGSPSRGETRASPNWRVTFSPASLVQDLNSVNEGIGYFAIVYVHVTAPSTAMFGNYPITITAASVMGTTEEDTMELIARVPLPDLYATPNDVVFSRFPVIKDQEMKVNVTIHNNGGAVERGFDVEFWVEDTLKKDDFIIIDVVRVPAIENQGEYTASVTLTPEINPRVKETLVTTRIRIQIDPLDEIIESDEDNNRVIANLEIMQTPKSSPGFGASLWMVMGIAALAVALAAGSRWNASSGQIKTWIRTRYHRK